MNLPAASTMAQPLSDPVGLLLREEMEILPLAAGDGSVVGVLSPIGIFRYMLKFARTMVPARGQEQRTSPAGSSGAIAAAAHISLVAKR